MSARREFLLQAIGVAALLSLCIVVLTVLGNEAKRRAPTTRPAVVMTPSHDLDCADIGHRVYVGANDPNHLDADGDGIGCERWGP